MLRYITPIILIGISIAGFFMLTSPMYKEITALKAESSSFNEALNNSKALENERDKLTTKYNTINPENLTKLSKLLPDSVDNIRLILEIEKIASPYGMVLQDVKYDTITEKTDTTSGQTRVASGAIPIQENKDYGTWSLEFSTSGTYFNFLNFIKDLEKNLRIVDISSIQFSSDAGAGLSPSSAGSYKYSFKIKTYWLKK